MEATKSKWHNVSIQTESFERLKEIQKRLPIRSSIPQVIEYLIQLQECLEKTTYENKLPSFDLIYAHNLMSTEKGKYDQKK
jgi:hypothetical protein